MNALIVALLIAATCLLVPHLGVTWSLVRRLFCRHAELSLSATRGAMIEDGTVILSAVEIWCESCDEFWHADLDASEAVSAALGMEEEVQERSGPHRIVAV